MKYFCKGAICGLIVGGIISSIVVAKNKNLSSSIKEKTDIISKKMAKLTSKIKEGLAKDDKKEEQCFGECVNDAGTINVMGRQSNNIQDGVCSGTNNCSNSDYYHACN